jgi:hypothetical protein
MKKTGLMGAFAIVATAFVAFSGRATASPVDAPEPEPLGGNVLWECACAAKCPNGEVVFTEPVCDTKADLKWREKRAVESCVEHAVAKCGRVGCACDCKSTGRAC